MAGVRNKEMKPSEQSVYRHAHSSFSRLDQDSNDNRQILLKGRQTAQIYHLLIIWVTQIVTKNNMEIKEKNTSNLAREQDLCDEKPIWISWEKFGLNQSAASFEEKKAAATGGV